MNLHGTIVAITGSMLSFSLQQCISFVVSTNKDFELFFPSQMYLMDKLNSTLVNNNALT